MNELEILRNLVVYNPVNKKIRLGHSGDGGYIIIDGYDYDFFMSGGISGDTSFEHSFIKKYSGIKGFAFDGTINYCDILPEEIIFISRNIGANSSEKLTNLTEYVKDYKNIFIKMDIEGGEWKWIIPFCNFFENVKQIVFEAHHVFLFENVLECLQILNKTHYLVHVHENNNSILYDIENTLYPDTLELTFIRKDCKVNGLNLDNFPIKDLDYPNVSWKPEHAMNMWPFNNR